MNKFKKIFQFDSYKQLYFFVKNDKFKVILITCLMIINVILNILIAVFTKTLIDEATDDIAGISIVQIILFAAIMIGFMFINGFNSYYTTAIKESMKNKLQISLLDTIYTTKWQKINPYKSGDLLTRLYSDILNIVEVWFSVIPNIIALILQFCIAFLILSQYTLSLAVIVFIVTPFCILFSWFIGKKMKRLQSEIQKEDSRLRSIINESLQNLIILKTFNLATHNIKKIITYQSGLYIKTMKKNNLSIKANLTLDLGYYFGFFLAIVLGSYKLSTAAISMGMFAAMLQLIAQIQGPLTGLTRSLPQLITSFSSVERLNELLNLSKDNEIPIENNDFSLVQDIQMDAVYFHYDHSEPILTNATLTLPKNSKIGIVGPSGVGKTTFIHLLLALLEPIKGSIKINIDGTYYPLSASTRQYFSYVPQNFQLFSGSIYDNLIDVNPTVSMAEINKALESSCALTFVNALEKGIHTEIGEHGTGLSQGQVQRIAIARALLFNTPYLIFDEATSSLDLDTEKTLIQNIEKYYQNKTIVTITHRESILSICDTVYKMTNNQFEKI